MTTMHARAMSKIQPGSLMTLEAYARGRKEFRARVMAHKKDRTIAIGDHLTLIFEDELTIRYQIQEMLRIERIFEEEGIRGELDAYNPLIPDGRNFKATMLIEFTDVDERKRALARLKGVEDRVWMAAAGHEKVFAIADEDLERENDEKTSSVHFLRFEFAPDMVAAIKGGADLAIGVDHPAMTTTIPALGAATRDSLLRDFA